MEAFMSLVTLIVTNIITYMILIDFFTTNYTLKISDISFYVMTVSMIICSVIINSYKLPNLNLAYIFIVLILLNVVVFNVRSYKNFLLNFSFFIVVFLLLDAGIYILMDNLFDLDSNKIIIDIKSITSSLLEYVIYNILKDFIAKKNNDSLKNIEIFSYLLLSSISFIIIWFSTFFINVQNHNLNVFIFSLIISFILLNIYMIKMMNTVSKTHELEEKVSIIERSSHLMLSHYRNLEETERKTKFILHDIKNHLATLENSITSDISCMYFESIKSEIRKLYSSDYTNRKILNILLNEKILAASKENIKIEIHNSALDLSFINDFDIVTIFSNLLDNAIEAVCDLPMSERIIKLYIKRINNFIIIRTNNSCLNGVSKKNGKIISSKKNHKGLGLMSIDNTLKNYDGNMVVEMNKDMHFTNTIMLCIPK